MSTVVGCHCLLLISFRTDWLDLLAVQETPKSLLQHYSSKELILWHSAFFMVQLSHRHMTTGKTVALTRWTSDSKMIALLFNTLSRFVISFLPGSKHLSLDFAFPPASHMCCRRQEMRAMAQSWRMCCVLFLLCIYLMEPASLRDHVTFFLMFFSPARPLWSLSLWIFDL